MWHIVIAALPALVSITQALSSQKLQITPAIDPVCDGLTSTGAGGMFGYSVSLSSGQDNSGYTWLAVGKPWDSTVHVYVAKNPDVSDLIRNLTANATTGRPSVTASPPVPPSGGPIVADNPISVGKWQELNQFGDVNNGSYPQRTYTLFGYSVALSEDGAWLAVGVPGRAYYSLSASIALDHSAFSGAVRIYRRQDTSTSQISAASPFKFIGEIPNPNAMPKLWDKFGSKVLFRRSTSTGRTFLFITSPGGWDGASANFDAATPASPLWPVGPTTDVSRAGVYVYQLNNPEQVNYQPGPAVTTAGNSSPLKFLQFIRQRSSVPLGSLGIDLDAMDISASQFSLLIRDFLIPPSVITADQQALACPTNNCSYITLDGRTFNATGVVLEYRFDPTAASFKSSGETLTGYGFPVSNYYLKSPPVNGATSDTPDWTRNDWFGVGISMAYDAKYNRRVAVVGAPKSSQGVYTFFTDQQQSSLQPSKWANGQFIINDYQYRQSFYGQRNQFSPDGRFLVVADPAGSAMSKGRGEVFLYYRRSSTEFLYPDTFNNVPVQPIPSAAQAPFFFDRLAQFSKSSTPVANDFPSFQSDHFGLGLAVNKYFAVFGAPIEQCMYTYSLPLAIELPDDGSNRPTGPGDYTIIPQPTGNTTVVNIQTITSSKAWQYGLIGGGVAVLLIIPGVMWLLKRRHKQKLLRQLKAKDAKHRISDSDFALNVPTNAFPSELSLHASPSKEKLQKKN